MLRSKATSEASMCPRLSELVMRIVGTAVMSHPLIVPGVNVRKFRMTFLVCANAVLGNGGGLLPSCGGGRAHRLGGAWQRASAWRPALERGRERGCVRHRSPRGDRRLVAAHRGPFPAQNLPSK